MKQNLCGDCQYFENFRCRQTGDDVNVNRIVCAYFRLRTLE